MMLASLLFAAVPVSAGTLSWSTETLPGRTNNLIVPAGEDILDVAVAPNGTTIYAAGGASLKLYKSTDTGATWTELSAAQGTTSFPATAVNLVAIAPDSTDGSIVAIQTGAQAVFYSSNGGSSWANLGVPAVTNAVSAIAISPAVSGVYIVLVLLALVIGAL